MTISCQHRPAQSWETKRGVLSNFLHLCNGAATYPIYARWTPLNRIDFPATFRIQDWNKTRTRVSGLSEKIVAQRNVGPSCERDWHRAHSRGDENNLPRDEIVKRSNFWTHDRNNSEADREYTKLSLMALPTCMWMILTEWRWTGRIRWPGESVNVITKSARPRGMITSQRIPNHIREIWHARSLLWSDILFEVDTKYHSVEQWQKRLARVCQIEDEQAHTQEEDSEWLPKMSE
jgi:hypothetical protein